MNSTPSISVRGGREPKEMSFVVPYLPPELGASATSRSRELHVRREPWTIAVENLLLLAELRPLKADEPVLAMASLELTIGGRPARLELPEGLKLMLLALVTPGAAHLKLGSVLEGLLLERLLEDVLRELEPVVGAVHSVAATQHVPSSECRRLSVHGENGISWPIVLHADDGLLVLMDQLWRARPLKRWSFPSLMADVALRIGRTRLTLTQFRSIGIGDVLLAMAMPPTRGTLMAVIEDYLACTIRITDGKLVVSDPIAKINALPGEWHGLGEDLMSEKDAVAGSADLAQLPIDLVFEVGRKRLSLAEIESMDAGYVIELERPMTEAVEICVKGIRIGWGELVMIQGRLGVRVTGLSRKETGIDA